MRHFSCSSAADPEVGDFPKMFPMIFSVLSIRGITLAALRCFLPGGRFKRYLPGTLQTIFNVLKCLETCLKNERVSASNHTYYGHEKSELFRQ
jgi:hypothetical protein